MKEEEKKKEGGIPWGFLLTIALLLLVSTLIYWQLTPWMHETEISNYLENQIEGRDDVSEDYVQGWNDCIDEYHRWFHRAQNVTSQMANNTEV